MGPQTKRAKRVALYLRVRTSEPAGCLKTGLQYKSRQCYRVRMRNYDRDGAGVDDTAKRPQDILSGGADRRADAHLGDHNGSKYSPQSVQRNGQALGDIEGQQSG